MKLGSNEVSVWQIDLEDTAWDAKAGVLSRDECIKADNFRIEKLKAHYRRCRAALRTLLAQCIGARPESLEFEYNEFGKPTLPACPLHFNLSHSASRAVIALASQPVGIDLEWLGRPTLEIDELAVLVCHDSEKFILERLPSSERYRHFLEIWTCKEAYIKALGIGLHRSLSEVCVLPSTGNAHRLQVRDEALDSPFPYFVYTLDTPADYLGKVCLADSAATITCATLQSDACISGLPCQLD